MKKIVLALFLLAGAAASAQNGNPATDELKKELQTVKSELQTLRTETRKLRGEVTALQTRLKAAGETIETLRQSTQSNSQAIRETADQLGVKISTTEASANQRFQEVGRSVSNTTLYVVIVLLMAIILSVLVYWFLSRRQKTDKSAIIEQVGKTKDEIEEKLVNEFDREIQLLVKKLENQVPVESDTPEPEIDHSLALKVASEINVIERNISLMSEGTKGLKQLKRSVGTLKDNLAANGYEVPQLLGKEFHEGMKVTVVNSIPDENLEAGAEVITKVIVPQVNYNGKMIQSAQIEVSVGPQDDDSQDSSINNNNITNTVQS
ncbi:MAG: CCDC90 family protein [Tannerella sp.]|jgi:cell division septum initiation protein DivIVA|nr:CCDC90 family protein [Tannerella sp.]